MVASKNKKEEELPDTVPVYNVNDGLTGRNGGPYLDEELAKEQERRNALREGREPDYSDLTAAPHSGVQLVTADQLLVAHRTAGAGFTGEITAPVYGHIPNPAKVEKERLERQAKAEAKRAKTNPDNTEPVNRSGPPDEVNSVASEGSQATEKQTREPAPSKGAGDDVFGETEKTSTAKTSTAKK